MPIRHPPGGKRGAITGGVLLGSYIGPQPASLTQVKLAEVRQWPSSSLWKVSGTAGRRPLIWINPGTIFSPPYNVAKKGPHLWGKMGEETPPVFFRRVDQGQGRWMPAKRYFPRRANDAFASGLTIGKQWQLCQGRSDNGTTGNRED